MYNDVLIYEKQYIIIPVHVNIYYMCIIYIPVICYSSICSIPPPPYCPP